MSATTSRLGRVSAWLGRLGVLLAAAGPLSAHFEVMAPLAGFALLALGVGLALCNLLLGVMALIVGPPGSRAATGLGMVPALVLVAVVYILARSGQGAPPINDVTTDPASPPQFVHARTLAENGGRDLTYPGESFAAKQRAAYPDLLPLALAMPPDEAFKQVAAAARSMPTWVITREDADARALEGYDTSRVFRFKYDIVIEVRVADNGQSIVQMRSKSRDAQADMGVNATRIRAFLQRLQS